MNNQELYKLLEIPYEAVKQLDNYEQCREIQITDSLKNKILKREN